MEACYMAFTKIRFSVEKYQSSKKGKKQSVTPFVLVAGLTFAALGSSLVLGGCTPTNEVNSKIDDTGVKSSNNVIVDENKELNKEQEESSKDWSELDTYDVDATVKYIKETCNKFSTNITDVEAKDVAELAKQLSIFSTHAKADVNNGASADVLAKNKEAIIDANKADALLNKGNTDVKKQKKEDNISDLLLDLSTDYKICKTLTISGASNGTVGQTIKLNVKCTPANAEVNYEFKSSDSKLATVSNTGDVKLISAGNVKITVTDKNTGVSDSRSISITKKSEAKKEEQKPTETKKEEQKKNTGNSGQSGGQSGNSGNGGSGNSGQSSSNKKQEQKVVATGVTLDNSSLSMTAGYGHELNAYILWSNNTQSYQGITWSSSNPSVASVSSSGYVTAKSAGTATITASYGSFSKSCTVTVKAAQQTKPSTPSKPSQPSNSATVVLEYNYDNLYEVEVGDELSVRPYVIENGVMLGGAGGSEYNIQYKSSNPSVATVSSDGYAKGISTGSATITATYGSSSVSVTISVLQATGSGRGLSGGKIVKGDWGWTQYDEQIGFWVVDSMYKDQWGNEYHAKTLEKDHAKDKLVTRNGQYTCYLCPEIVPAFNAYLKDHGYNYEFKWYCDLEDGHRDMTNYPNKNSNSMTQGCIDNYEKMCKTQIMSHETDYSTIGALIIGDMSEGYDFYGLIKSIHEEAPSHWNALLKGAQKRGIITAVLAPCKPNDLSSGFLVFIR